MGLDWYALIVRPMGILLIAMLAVTSDLRKAKRQERKARRQARRAERSRSEGGIAA